MSTDLTVVNPSGNAALTTQAFTGSLIDFSNPLLRLRPATITLVQKGTEIEGAVPGNLRLDSGDQYKEMTVALLAMPQTLRQWHGTPIPGTLYRKPENLQCYSLDNIAPHAKSKNPQALTCANCEKGSWARYQQTGLKTDIPECDQFYKAILLDTVFQMPLQLYARSKVKQAFEKDIKLLARELYKLHISLKGQRDVNFYEVKFKLSSRQITTKGLKSYVYNMSDFSPVTVEDREAFGDVYKMFIEFAHAQPAEAQLPTFDEDQAEKAINNIIDGDYETIKDEEIPF